MGFIAALCSLPKPSVSQVPSTGHPWGIAQGPPQAAACNCATGLLIRTRQACLPLNLTISSYMMGKKGRLYLPGCSQISGFMNQYQRGELWGMSIMLSTSYFGILQYAVLSTIVTDPCALQCISIPEPADFSKTQDGLAHGTLTMLPAASGPLPLLSTPFGKLPLPRFAELTLPFLVPCNFLRGAFLPGLKPLPEAQKSAHLHLMTLALFAT